MVGGEAVAIIKELEGLPPVFTSEYYSDFHGEVKYMEFNPHRYDYDAFRESQEYMQEKCVIEAQRLFGDFVEVV